MSGEDRGSRDEPRQADEESANSEEIPVDTDADIPGGPRQRIEDGAEEAVSEFDARLVDILSWVLDTETRGRIYVYLRKHPGRTSEEVAKGTGLYPSTVREALANLADEEIVTRTKRESEGAGNNPYEYTAIPPSELVGNVVGQVQTELNTLFNMDAHLEDSTAEETEPVRIDVVDPDEDESTDDA
jgi:predicted transcriptional regulator